MLYNLHDIHRNTRSKCCRFMLITLTGVCFCQRCMPRLTWQWWLLAANNYYWQIITIPNYWPVLSSMAAACSLFMVLLCTIINKHTRRVSGVKLESVAEIQFSETYSSTLIIIFLHSYINVFVSWGMSVIVDLVIKVRKEEFWSRSYVAGVVSWEFRGRRFIWPPQGSGRTVHLQMCVYECTLIRTVSVYGSVYKLFSVFLKCWSLVARSTGIYLNFPSEVISVMWVVVVPGDYLCELVMHNRCISFVFLCRVIWNIVHQNFLFQTHLVWVFSGVLRLMTCLLFVLLLFATLFTYTILVWNKGANVSGYILFWSVALFFSSLESNQYYLFVSNTPTYCALLWKVFRS